MKKISLYNLQILILLNPDQSCGLYWSQNYPVKMAANYACVYFPLLAKNQCLLYVIFCFCLSLLLTLLHTYACTIDASDLGRRLEWCNEGEISGKRCMCAQQKFPSRCLRSRYCRVVVPLQGMCIHTGGRSMTPGRRRRSWGDLGFSWKVRKGFATQLLNWYSQKHVVGSAT